MELIRPGAWENPAGAGHYSYILLKDGKMSMFVIRRIGNPLL